VASVRRQTCGQWELLIADDGSTDGSLGALPADRRIRVIRLAHTGNVARVRNAALEAAAAGLVGFLDSDDIWRPGKLAAQVARLEDCPEAGWCYGRHGLIDERGTSSPIRSGPAWVPREGLIVREILEAQAGVAMQTVLVRREVAAAIGFDERIPFADDHDFLVRLAFTSSACVIDEVVAEVREHAGRTTRHRYDHPGDRHALWRLSRHGVRRHAEARLPAAAPIVNPVVPVPSARDRSPPARHCDPHPRVAEKTVTHRVRALRA
jgi:glycosyltransferase involved in cell wall biosynthesis